VTSWHSYPSIYNLGHRYIKDLFTVPVDIEEKVDGSQFSFGLFDESYDVGCDERGHYGFTVETTRLRVRSKGVEFPIEAPPAMFKKACETVQRLHAEGMLRLGWTYRGEVLQKPKHNALQYDRTPVGNIILFDINPGEEHYLTYQEKVDEASRLGLEVVPLLYQGRVNSADELRVFLNETKPRLGSEFGIEGIVIKPTNHDLFGIDKKLMMGKFVREEFKEVHKEAWTRGGEHRNFTSRDILDRLGDQYRTQQRWHKAIQHVRERGQLTDSPKDIGLLMKEVPEDILKECKEEILEALLQWAMRDLRKSWCRGLAEFYKEELLKKQFEGEAA